jgi:hypothetical protein
MDLLSLFRSLPRPNVEEGGTAFRVAPIPGFEIHRLGKDGVGAPALLVHVSGGDGHLSGPVVLRHLAVQHGVRCKITSCVNAVGREEDVTLVRCASGEPTLRDYFVRVAELAARHLGPTPSRDAVNRTVRKLTELFQSFEHPARKTVQGLWAELLVIRDSSEPSALVEAWHVDPDEAFDFMDGPDRLEVKSFSGEGRLHRFSLRQARPGGAIQAVFASLKAERGAGGSTIADLVVGIQHRGISAEAALKVDAVVARSLGDLAANGFSLAFDIERARESVRFFAADAVPSIDPALPSGVSRVRFDALLDEARALPMAALQGRGRLFAAAAKKV